MFLSSRENSKYIARAKEWPEVVVEEDTCDEAIEQIKMRLVDYLTNQVEVIEETIHVI